MKLRQAALLAMSGLSIYTAYYLAGIIGVALEIQELIDINKSMAIFIRQHGYIRVLLLPVLVYVPLIIFFYTLHKR